MDYRKEVRQIETRVQFSIRETRYILFIEKGLLKDRLNLFECQKGNRFLKPVPIAVSSSTPGESIDFRMGELKRRLRRWKRGVGRKLIEEETTERGQKTDPCNGAKMQEILSIRLRRLQEHLWDVLETDPGNVEAICSLSSALDSLKKRISSLREGINAGETEGGDRGCQK